MNNLIDKIRALQRRLHELCPVEFLLLASVLFVALPLILDASAVTTILLTGSYLVFLALLLPWRDALIGVLATILVLGSWTIINHRNANHIIHQLHRGRAYNTVQLKITDRTLSALPNSTPPKAVSANVLAWGKEQQPCVGKVLLNDVKGIQLKHGDILQVTGSIQTPTNYRSYDNKDGYRASESLANFNNYLNSRRIAATIRADQIEVLEQHSSWLTHAREYLVAQAVAGLKTPEAIAMTQALFFGSRQDLTSDTRRDLVFSGTMHIFSVSGMHVAVLAFVLLIAFRFIPYKCRYWMLTGTLLLYVVFTGAQVPAIRALIMIGVYSLLKIGFYRTPSLKLLIITGSFMIALNPYELVDAGFFFSFVVTGFLLMLSEVASEVRSIENIIDRYKARTPTPYFRRVLSGLLWLLAGCIIAFISGCGISLFCFGLILPGSILANMLLAGLLNLLFPLIILNLLMGWIESLNLAFAWALDKLFAGFEIIIQSTASWFSPSDLSIPALGGVILFYLLLAAILRTRRIPWIIMSLSVILIMGLWSSRSINPAPPILAFIKSPYSETPGVLIIDPQTPYAIALNLPLQSSGVIHRLLKERGVNQLDALVFSANVKDASADASRLASLVDIEKIFLLDPQIRSNQFAKMLASLKIPVQVLPEGKYLSSLWQIEAKKSILRLEYSNNYSHIKIIMHPSSEETTVQIGERIYKPHVEKSSLLEVFIYE